MMHSGCKRGKRLYADTTCLKVRGVGGVAKGGNKKAKQEVDREGAQKRRI